MASNPSDQNAILEGTVTRVLLGMAVPVALGMLSTFLFQVVDTYFVGMLGPEFLAAISFTSPVYMLLMSLNIGLSVGVSTVIAKALGAGDRQRAGELAALSIGLVVVVSIVVCGLGYLTIGPTFRALGARGEIVSLVSTYMSILYVGMPCVMTGLICGGILRASGRARAPEVIMAIAGAINLVLDYVLIFGVGPFPELGLAGAALATAIAWVFVLVGMLVVLARAGLVRVQGLKPRTALREIRGVLGIGVPAMATQILTPVTTLLITYLVARHGADAIAAFGVASRIQALAMVGVFGVGTAVTPFIAQNLGAGLQGRIDDAIVFAGKAATYWGIGVFAVLALTAAPLAAMFSDSEAVQYYTRMYFYIVGATYVPFGLLSVTASIFNGVVDPTKALRILIAKAVFTVPLVVVGSTQGAVGIFAALAISNVLGGIYAARTMKRHLAAAGTSLAQRDARADYVADLAALFGGR